MTVALLLWPGLGSAQKIDYLASYRGVFSLFQQIDIANVEYRISSHAVSPDRHVREIRLMASSAAYPTVEKLYPFRYLYKSYSDTAFQHTLLLENLKTTQTKRKFKHQLGLFDQDSNAVQLYQTVQKEEIAGFANLQQLLSAGLEPDADALNLTPAGAKLEQLESMPVDRLVLLEQIRQQVRDGRQQAIYRVTNGDELFDYRVALLNREIIKLGKKPVDTSKVKIEAFELSPEGTRVSTQQDAFSDLRAHTDAPGKYAHAPVYVWFSNDDSASPLRFLNRHAVGDFMIESVLR